ncbi:MAG: hypothetical protein MJK12_19985, partial [Colwellia sp.]|nr:hypothetical protein [Colwellia sp.]
MQYSKLQSSLFFTNKANKIKVFTTYMNVRGIALMLFLLLLLFQIITISNAKADIVQDAINESEKLSPARLFDRNSLLFNKKNLSSVKLSPNGQYLFFLVKEGTKQQLWSHDIKSNTTSKLFSSRMIKNIYWTQDSQSIFLHLDTGVAIVDVSPGAKPSIILKLERQKQQFFYGPDDSSPHHFFVWQKEINADTNGKYYVLYRVNRHGMKQKLYTADKIMKDFLAPGGGPIRFFTENYGLTNIIYDLASGEKREVYRCYYTDYCGLLSYQQQSNVLYLKGRGKGDLIKLLALDLSANEAVQIGNKQAKIVHQDPEQRFDLDQITFDPISGEPIMVSYYTDFYQNYGLTKIVNKHLNKIKQTLNSPVIKL